MRLRAATVEEIAAVPGMSVRIAEGLKERLGGMPEPGAAGEEA